MTPSSALDLEIDLNLENLSEADRVAADAAAVRDLNLENLSAAADAAAVRAARVAADAAAVRDSTKELELKIYEASLKNELSIALVMCSILEIIAHICIECSENYLKHSQWKDGLSLFGVVLGIVSAVFHFIAFAFKTWTLWRGWRTEGLSIFLCVVSWVCEGLTAYVILGKKEEVTLPYIVHSLPVCITLHHMILDRKERKSGCKFEGSLMAEVAQVEGLKKELSSLRKEKLRVLHSLHAKVEAMKTEISSVRGENTRAIHSVPILFALYQAVVDKLRKENEMPEKEE